MREHCEWKRIAGNENDGMYLVSCGEVQMLEGVPVDDRPCPYCGKPIRVTVEARANA